MYFRIITAIALLATLVQAHMSRDTEAEVVTDTTSQLMWQDNREPDILLMNWDDGVAYCKDLVMAGYEDWRLPSKAELLTIIDPEGEASKINGIFLLNEDFQHLHPDVYWTSDIVKSEELLAWRINFDEGKAYWGAKRFEFHVRCVRDFTPEQ